MRAVLCRRLDGPEGLELAEIPEPPLREGCARVAVRAAALNFPDVLMAEGLYQIRHELPFVPGMECAGVVEQVADGVTGLRVGQRVICRCGIGAFAERIVLSTSAVHAMPEGMDFPTGAGFSVVYGTSYYALQDRGRLSPGETLLVLGAAGGVGLAAVEIGRALGAKVIAAAGAAEKRAVCLAHGADWAVDYRTAEGWQQLTALAERHGVDVVYDAVGGDASGRALALLRPGGRLLVIGFAAGTIPRLPVSLIQRREAAVIGVSVRQFAAREPARHAAQMRRLLSWWREGQLQPRIGATFPLSEVREAYRALRNRAVSGKLVLLI